MMLFIYCTFHSGKNIFTALCGMQYASILFPSISFRNFLQLILHPRPSALKQWKYAFFPPSLFVARRSTQGPCATIPNASQLAHWQPISPSLLTNSRREKHNPNFASWLSFIIIHSVDLKSVSVLKVL